MNTTADKSCCTPKRHNAGETEKTDSAQLSTIQLSDGEAYDVCDIPGGVALTGTNAPKIPIDEESPLRQSDIKPFRMMATAVTNAMFQKFIKATSYKTDAEKHGWSFVFYKQLPEDFKATQAVANTQWWRKVDGATWKQICGPGVDSPLDAEHPVIHVSWNDAHAYAKWAGGRLPTETEWEHAARGGLSDAPFPWGNRDPDDTTYQPCNIWQGNFPQTNTNKDGYSFTAPARSFEPNGYGLYNMCGNVWEWTSGRIKIKGKSDASRQHAKNYKGCKLLKGGSFLCHKSYCFRYRIAARTGNTPDSTTTHQGFRLVFDR